jgi:hypothetical protein
LTLGLLTLGFLPFPTLLLQIGDRRARLRLDQHLNRVMRLALGQFALDVNDLAFAAGHILAAANAIIAEDKARLGKTLFTRKGQGTPVELMSFATETPRRRVSPTR